MLIFVFRPAEPWDRICSNSFVDLFLALIKRKFNSEDGTCLLSDEILQIVANLLKRSTVNYATSTTKLRKPVKHVFMIILESVRYDAFPLQESLFYITKHKVDGITLPSLTPTVDALLKRSLHGKNLAMGTYTLKSLMSLICGIYPLPSFFNGEYKLDTFYNQCLPNRFRSVDREGRRRSSRSSFFTGAGHDFDYQGSLIEKFGFDDIFQRDDIIQRHPDVEFTGWFGVSDKYTVPMMLDWVRKNLKEDPERQLFSTMLTTISHYPFDLPSEENSETYVRPVDYFNEYLNTLRITDKYIKQLIDGLKAMGIYEESLLVLIGDHGIGFSDYGNRNSGQYRNSHESCLATPVVISNPHLDELRLPSEMIGLDLLPTILDALVSSSSLENNSINVLEWPRAYQLEALLDNYEGCSQFRNQNSSYDKTTRLISPPDVKMSDDEALCVNRGLKAPFGTRPWSFHIPNPGSIITLIKQGDLKLVYDNIDNFFGLYHVKHDPEERINLLKVQASHTIPWLSGNPTLYYNRVKQWKWDANLYTLCKYRHDLPYSLPDPHAPFPELYMQAFDLAMSKDVLDIQLLHEWAEYAYWLGKSWHILIKARYNYGSIDIGKDEVENMVNGYYNIID